MIKYYNNSCLYYIETLFTLNAISFSKSVHLRKYLVCLKFAEVYKTPSRICFFAEFIMYNVIASLFCVLKRQYPNLTKTILRQRQIYWSSGLILVMFVFLGNFSFRLPTNLGFGPNLLQNFAAPCVFAVPLFGCVYARSTISV